MKPPQLPHYVFGLLCWALTALPGAAQNEPPYTIRVTTEVVQISAVVKDRAGNFVRGLEPREFELLEDGRRQSLIAVDLESVRTSVDAAAPLPAALPLLTSAASVTPSSARGLRLVVLFFDLTSLELDDTARVIRAAERYVSSLEPADRVAVISLANDMRVQQDFTADAEALKQAIARVRLLAQTGLERGEEDSKDGGSNYELFNDDRRLRSLRLLSNLLRRLPQMKSVVLFARASGSGGDNLAGLTATVNDATRAGVSIYAVDGSGLQATPPMGDATHASSYGTAVLSGHAVVAQGAQAMHSQDLLYALARGTGGRSFFDSNDFERPFRTVNDDTREYYLLSYRPSETRQDGRFRRIAVHVRRPHLEVVHQAGYYVPSHTDVLSTEQRERQFQEELAVDLPAQELPVYAALAYVNVGAGKYYVPTTVLLPLSSLAEKTQSGSSLEIAAVFRDTEGKLKQMVRQTITVADDTGRRGTAGVVQYNTGATLSSGTYKVRVVVRDNSTGKTGAFDATLYLPASSADHMVIGPILTGWETPVRGAAPENPLVDGGRVLIPNPLATYTPRDTVAFRYDLLGGLTPPIADIQRHTLNTALQCFKGSDRVFHSEPLLPSEMSGDSAVVRTEIPAGALSPGSYVCQVTAIDEARGQFATARTRFAIRGN